MRNGLSISVNLNLDLLNPGFYLSLTHPSLPALAPQTPDPAPSLTLLS